VSRLALRRGTVLSVDREGPAAELTVDVEGERRRALSYEDMTGAAEAGDDVVVNVAAVDLELGSGGFDVVHANLTRGLGGGGEPGAHVMKLNYTSLQHAVHPVEERTEDRGQSTEDRGQRTEDRGQRTDEQLRRGQPPTLKLPRAKEVGGQK
jgi:uncharacterized protein DUF3866